MKIFVTGATGFVGHHVAKALAAEGADLRLLVRKIEQSQANLEGLDLGSRGDTFTGDLLEPGSLKSAMAGCDAVVHVAADYRLWIPDPAAMYSANVDGTRELLRMAREAGVKRFVFTSSVATMHFRTDGIVINEDTPVSLKPTWSVTTSARSSWPSRRHLHAAEQGQQVMILNPTTPIGPNDWKPTPTGRIFVDFLNGKFPAYVDTGLNLVDVAEVARAHVLALTRATPGRRYILGGENLTLKQILDKMSAITGIPSPTVEIPFAVAATYAFFEEWITGRIRGKEPSATLEEVRMGRKKMYASSAHAVQELGFSVVPVYPGDARCDRLVSRQRVCALSDAPKRTLWAEQTKIQRGTSGEIS
jgi:dihydroflavonol-4-reductase